MPKLPFLDNEEEAQSENSSSLLSDIKNLFSKGIDTRYFSEEEQKERALRQQEFAKKQTSYQPAKNTALTFDPTKANEALDTGLAFDPTLPVSQKTYVTSPEDYVKKPFGKLFKTEFDPSQFETVEQIVEQEEEAYQKDIATIKTAEEWQKKAEQFFERASIEKNPKIKAKLLELSQKSENHSKRLGLQTSPQPLAVFPTATPTFNTDVEEPLFLPEMSTASRLQDLMAKYKAAQEKYNQGQTLESLMTSGESVAKAIAGAGYIPTAATIVPQANIGNLYGQDMKALDKEMAVTPIAESMENYDVASDISEMARESLKTMLNNAGIKIPKGVDNMSAAQISKVFPMFEPQIRAQIESAQRQADKETKKQEKRQKVLETLTRDVFKSAENEKIRALSQEVMQVDDTTRQLREYAENPDKVNSVEQMTQIYRLIKSLDPTSVVREGEIAFFLKGEKWGDWVERNLSKATDVPKLIGTGKFKELVNALISAQGNVKKKFNETYAKALQNNVKSILKTYELEDPQIESELLAVGLPYWDFEKGDVKGSSPAKQATNSELKKTLEKAEQALLNSSDNKDILNTIKEIEDELNSRNQNE